MGVSEPSFAMRIVWFARPTMWPRRKTFSTGFSAGFRVSSLTILRHAQGFESSVGLALAEALKDFFFLSLEFRGDERGDRLAYDLVVLIPEHFLSRRVPRQYRSIQAL